MTSVSPNEKDRLIITEHPHGPDASLEIDLNKGERRIGVYSDKADRVPSFAEVVWLSETPIVGALVCDPFSADHYVVVVFNTATEQAEEPRKVLQPLRITLVARYGLTMAMLAEYGSDPISWACSQFSGAQERFHSVVGKSRMLPVFPK